MKKGYFITIDGGKGIKKSTQSNRLYNYLWNKKIKSYVVKGTSSTETSDKIFSILMDNDLSELANTCLITACKENIFDEIILPKINDGITVILERSDISTLALQGYAGGIRIGLIKELINLSRKKIKPDLSIIIDIDPLIGLSKESYPDKFSEKGIEYHRKARKGYLEIAKDMIKQDYNSCVLIKYGDRDENRIHTEIIKAVENKLLNRFCPINFENKQKNLENLSLNLLLNWV